MTHGAFEEFRNVVSAVPETRPDFSLPGGDGALPDGFVEWRRGLTYTVRPTILHPLRRGHHYRINATVRRNIAKGETFTYDDVYRRATAITDARIVELRSGGEEVPLHTWILAQAWFCHELGTQTLVSASITKGLIYPADDTPQPRGEDIPSATHLTAPSGGVPAAFADRHRNAPEEAPYLDEIYVDFDMSDPAGPSNDITLSYGEYVAACQGVHFEPFVERAEGRARFHCSQPFRIFRREWSCLSTNKQKDPHIVVVHLWIQL